MTLEEAIAKIKPLDHNAMEIAQKRWDSIAKPLHSLGKLETLLIQIAGITGNAEVDLSRRGLIAMRICPAARDYILASHVSKEPAAQLILENMGKEAIIHADMCLGEGTGAVALFPILDLAAAVYHSMSTFNDIHVEQYEELK